MTEKTAQSFVLIIAIGVVASLVAMFCVVFNPLTVASVLIIAVSTLTVTFCILSALYGIV